MLGVFPARVCRRSELLIGQCTHALKVTERGPTSSRRRTPTSLGLGGTLGVTVSGNFFLKFTYGQIVARNSNGLNGRAIRLVAATAF